MVTVVCICGRPDTVYKHVYKYFLPVQQQYNYACENCTQLNYLRARRGDKINL